MARAFDRASAIRPFNIRFISDHGLDYPVGSLQYSEAANQIHLGPDRNARTARVEQTAEGRNHRSALKQGMIRLRVEQPQAVLQLAQVLRLRQKRLNPAMLLFCKVTIQRIE
jgi:hypothetical protein